jgi:hypothetical protein
MARRRAASHHVQVMRQQVAQEKVRLAELQQAINIIRQQEQTQDSPQLQLPRQAHHYQQLLQ